MALVPLLVAPSLLLPAGTHFSLCISHNDAPCHDPVDIHVADTCGGHDHTPPSASTHESDCCPHDSGIATSDHCLDFEWVVSEEPLQLTRTLFELPVAPESQLFESSRFSQTMPLTRIGPLGFRQAAPPPSPPRLVALQCFRC